MALSPATERALSSGCTTEAPGAFAEFSGLDDLEIEKVVNMLTVVI